MAENIGGLAGTIKLHFEGRHAIIRDLDPIQRDELGLSDRPGFGPQEGDDWSGAEGFAPESAPAIAAPPPPADDLGDW